METSLELSRWRERPRGVGYRRWTIVSTGVRQLLGTRYIKALITIAWIFGAGIALAGFSFSQSVAPGGWLERLATSLGPRAEAIEAVIGGLIVLYPDITIGGLFTLTFWMHSFIGLWLTLFALTTMVPRLVTQDRASNALTAYLSRPLTTVDYLLGKLGTIAGITVLLWTGPLLFGWLLSMMFAPDRDFIYYSFSPLLHALLFNGIALVVTSAIALGVSAIGRSSRTTTVIWVCLWILAGTLATSNNASDSIHRASFTNNLTQVRDQVFHLDDAFNTASEQLPLLSPNFAAAMARAGQRSEPTDFTGALFSLAAFVGISSLVFFRKLRTE